MTAGLCRLLNNGKSNVQIRSATNLNLPSAITYQLRSDFFLFGISCDQHKNKII